MEHGHDIGTTGEGFAVAGLLIGSVAPISVVNDRVQTEFAGKRWRFVTACVIDQDEIVDKAGWDILDRPA